jgi:hypothetical protein
MDGRLLMFNVKIDNSVGYSYIEDDNKEIVAKVISINFEDCLCKIEFLKDTNYRGHEFVIGERATVSLEWKKQL